MIFSGPVLSNNKSWVIEAGIICHLSLSKHYNFDAWESHIWAQIKEADAFLLETGSEFALKS